LIVADDQFRPPFLDWNALTAQCGLAVDAAASKTDLFVGSIATVGSY
jgi:hypothetical protein